MGFKKWQVAEYDKELAKSLAEECGIDPIANMNTVHIRPIFIQIAKERPCHN